MFSSKIDKLVESIHPNITVNTVALSVIDDLLVWLMVKLLKEANELAITPTDGDEYDEAIMPSVKLFQRLYFGTRDNTTAHAEICPWMAFVEFPDSEEFDESVPGYKPASVLSVPFATGNKPPEGWTPKSFDARTIQSAVRQVIPRELAMYVLPEGFKAVKAFNSSHDNRVMELASGLRFVPGAIRYQVPK
jgi:hypothetical protein